MRRRSNVETALDSSNAVVSRLGNAGMEVGSRS
jgi:hypothetical protein